MGKGGRVKAMSSVTLLSSSLLIEQHTVLSVAVLKKTWGKKIVRKKKGTAVGKEKGKRLGCRTTTSV